MNNQKFNAFRDVITGELKELVNKHGFTIKDFSIPIGGGNPDGTKFVPEIRINLISHEDLDCEPNRNLDFRNVVSEFNHQGKSQPQNWAVTPKSVGKPSVFNKLIKKFLDVILRRVR